jgi:hypothetical protein
VTLSGSTCEEKKADEDTRVFAPNSNFMAITDPLETQTVTPAEVKTRQTCTILMK